MSKKTENQTVTQTVDKEVETIRKAENEKPTDITPKNPTFTAEVITKADMLNNVVSSFNNVDNVSTRIDYIKARILGYARNELIDVIKEKYDKFEIWAEKNLKNCSKSTANMYANICDKFKLNHNSNVVSGILTSTSDKHKMNDIIINVADTTIFTDTIKDKDDYTFSISQLQELLPLFKNADDSMKSYKEVLRIASEHNITSAMTTKAIREVVDKIRGKAPKNDDKSNKKTDKNNSTDNIDNIAIAYDENKTSDKDLLNFMLEIVGKIKNEEIKNNLTEKINVAINHA